MTNDTRQTALRNYRKLNYFYESKTPVHFKIQTGEFRNGIILDLNQEKLVMVLKEDIIGCIPLLLEDIKEETIIKKREEKNDMGNNPK